MIEGNDPLTDKIILERLVENGLPSRLKRSTENPDILIAVSKNADESIASTYIPPTSRVVNTGSRTTSQYNYLSHGFDYTTRQQNRVIQEGGYTETTKETDIFLELTILDAKRINSPEQVTAPIIWQMTVKRHVLNADFNIMDEYLAYASWSTKIPTVFDRLVVKKINASYLNVELSGRTIVLVRENSSAQRMGLQAGDEFVKARSYKHWVTDMEYMINLFKVVDCDYKIRRNGKIVSLKGCVREGYGELSFFQWQMQPGY